MWDELWDAWLDLAIGSVCALCRSPGRALCQPCQRRLPARAQPSWPSPTPAGLVLPCSAGEYDGALRDLVLAYKERHSLSLARPIGRLIALAVLEVGVQADLQLRRSGVVLVPVPSHPSVVRVRGFDAVGRATRVAAARLRSEGIDARVGSALVLTSLPRDQAGLGSEARAQNLHGRFAGRPGRWRGPIVLVDDVITTGATLREAQRALEVVGASVVGAATAAATRKRQVVRNRDFGKENAPRLPESAGWV